MAVTTDPFTASDLASFIPEYWTPIVNEALFADAVLVNFCMDLSPYTTEGADIFHVPDIFTNKLTVSTQSTQGAEITTASPASVDTTLTVNTHKYVAFIMGDKDIAQLATKYQLHDKYAVEATSLLLEAVEQDLAALWSSITTNTIGDTATVLADAEIRQGIEKLATGKYKLAECAFFFHTYIFWNQLHAVAKYYQQYSVGPSNVAGPVSTGNFGEGGNSQYMVGRLYGMPVYATPNIVSGLQTYRNLLLHKSAFGFAFQTKGGNRVRVQAENAIRNLGILTVVDVIYGVGVLREPGAVLLNGSSAFIGS